MDLPDFYKTAMQWPRRDWATKEVEYETVRWVTPVIQPDSGLGASTDPIPSGKIFYVTDISITSPVQGHVSVYIADKFYMFESFIKRYEERGRVLSIPLPAVAGDKLEFHAWNYDITPDQFTFVVTGWWETL